MEIIIPEGWHDVSVNQYQGLKELDRDSYKSDLSYANVILQVLCDIPTAAPFTLDVIAKIMPHISFTQSMPSHKRVKSFEHNGSTYEWIGDFGQLTVGEAISIEQIIDLEELSYDQSFDVILAVLLRKDGEAFSAESFTRNRVAFGELPISKVIGMLLFFLSGGKIYINNTADYSIVTATKKKIILRKSGRLNSLLQKIAKVRLLISGWLWSISFRKETLRMTKQLTK